VHRSAQLSQGGWIDGLDRDDAGASEGNDGLERRRPRYGRCGAAAGSRRGAQVPHQIGVCGAIQRGGSEMVAAWIGEADKRAMFAKRFPDVKIVKTQEEIINGPSIQLVLSSQIPYERAPLGVRVMKQGEDFLADKPGITTLA